MKAVILAAGFGSRLIPITYSKPKCLTLVNGKTILDWQLEAYLAAGINEFIIVVGYKSEEIIKHIRFNTDIKDYKIIHNRDFESTNNMYSLYLTKDDIAGKPFFLSNADVVVDKNIVHTMLNSPHKDLIAIDTSSYYEESMKVAVNDKDLCIDISKKIPQHEALGNSIDFYCFSEATSAALFSHIQHIIETEKKLNDWTEVAIQKLLKEQKYPIKPLDIKNNRWLEIDDLNDLAKADKIFNDHLHDISSKKLYFIDLDGTIYLGNQLIQGATDFISKLKEKHIPFYFITNNSSCTQKEYQTKLTNFGIAVEKEQIVTPIASIIAFLNRHKIQDIFLLANEAIKKEFAEYGINVDAENPEYVIVCYDTELSFEKLKKACLALHQGAALLASHIDVVCPTPAGPVPDVGSYLSLIKSVTQADPICNFGKPSMQLVDHLIKKHQASHQDIAIIGDRIYTDIQLAKNLRALAIIVLSGETTRLQLETTALMPEIIVNNVGELVEYL